MLVAFLESETRGAAPIRRVGVGKGSSWVIRTGSPAPAADCKQYRRYDLFRYPVLSDITDVAVFVCLTCKLQPVDQRIAALEEALNTARADASRFQAETQKTVDLLKKEQETVRAARAQEVARRGVLTRCIQECNDLQAEKESLAKKVRLQELELEQVRP